MNLLAIGIFAAVAIAAATGFVFYQGGENTLEQQGEESVVGMGTSTMPVALQSTTTVEVGLEKALPASAPEKKAAPVVQKKPVAAAPVAAKPAAPVVSAQDTAAINLLIAEALSSRAAKKPYVAIEKYQQALGKATDVRLKVSIAGDLADVYMDVAQKVQALDVLGTVLSLAAKDSFEESFAKAKIAWVNQDAVGIVLYGEKALGSVPLDAQMHQMLAMYFTNITSQTSQNLDFDTESYGPYKQTIDYPRALSHAEKAYRSAPTAFNKELLALLYFRNKNYAEALVLESDSGPESAYFDFWVSVSAAKIGNLQASDEYLDRAVTKGIGSGAEYAHARYVTKK